MSEYPLAMRHPSHKQAELSNAGVNMSTGAVSGNAQGKPEMWPPVNVTNSEQEEYHRAQGYVGATEPFPEVGTHYSDYPVMLYHPDYKPAVFDKTDILKRLEQEQFPPRIAASPDDEERLEADGYKRRGHADAPSFDKAYTAPGMPGDEWPKLINGVLVEDPDAAPPLPPDVFPMWVHPEQGEGRVVNDSVEYAKVMGKPYPGTAKAETASVAAVAVAEPEADEMAEFRAWKAAQAAQKAPPEQAAQDQDEAAKLRGELDSLGAAYDKRWGKARLQKALDEALAK